jgi:predicted dehydrogenase
VNRREFLYTGTALTATAGMTAKSYAAVAGANDRVNLGVIGTGRRATVVCGAGFTQDPRVQIVALCDVYGKQLADFQSKFKSHLSNPAIFVDYHDMLARKDIDNVFIAIPDHLHVQVACDAMLAGKNIYLEKPTLHRWHEREALITAHADSGKVLQCGMQQRSGSHYLKARDEIIGTGVLGDVVMVRATWSNFPWQRRVIPAEPKPADLRWDLFLGSAPKVPYEYSRYSSWRSYHDYGNGLLADILTHWVDVAQWLMNDDQPMKASALGGDYVLNGDLTNPDTVSAIIQYKKWNLSFESSVLSIKDPRPAVLFQGTKGNLSITRGGYVMTPNEGDPVTVDYKAELEVAHTKNFVDAIVRGAKLNAPLAAGLSATRPVEMALRSYWDKKTIASGDLT